MLFWRVSKRCLLTQLPRFHFCSKSFKNPQRRPRVTPDSKPNSHLPLEAVGPGRVASLQEARRGGPAGRVLPGRRLLRSDPRLAAAAERPVEGEQGGVAAAPYVEGHICGTDSSRASASLHLPPPTVETLKHRNKYISRAVSKPLQESC